MQDKVTAQICVPVCEPNLAAMKQAAARAVQEGNLVELRLDCLDADELERATKEIDSCVPAVGRPVILTLRPAVQGGHEQLTKEFRLAFFKDRTNADFLDIELDLALSPEAVNTLDWHRVICSYHDFSGVPENLEQIYTEMAGTPARILKIAVRANDLTDCIPLFRLLERARKERREMIAIAMGTAGIPTRILGPSWGSFLTYGPMESESSTAPGQITAGQLKKLYRIDKIDSHTQITGLLGSPVSHSVSPLIHNAAFEATGVNGVYIPFEVRDVKAFIRRMVDPATREMAWNFRGLSVTSPFKIIVMDLLAQIEPAAREIGAVNTIVVERDGLSGYNTDGAALVQPLINRVGALRDLRCAVIGAGGAGRAALWSLRRMGAVATVFARDTKKARPISEMFSSDCRPLTDSSFSEFDVVINTTPLGTRGALAEKTVAMASQLRGARLAYDLVYNPAETRFLREAREAGCETLGGAAMLVFQAAQQFKLWTGRDAPLEVMSGAADKAIGPIRPIGPIQQHE
jgi:3-dehydroquinate dehydratase/shikimate dehydrogenase